MIEFFNSEDRKISINPRKVFATIVCRDGGNWRVLVFNSGLEDDHICIFSKDDKDEAFKVYENINRLINLAENC